MSHEERIEALEKKLAAVKAQLNGVCAHDSVVARPTEDLAIGTYGMIGYSPEYLCQECGVTQRSPFGSAFKKATP